MKSNQLHVGIVGAGLGGLTAATAIARAGAQVTVLEQAAELGELGAGIQMFGNVSRWLVRTGIDAIIGDNLVQMDEVRTWGHGDGHPMIGRIDVSNVVKIQGFPWWVVRRDHLHAGLAEGARRHGVELVVGFRTCKLEYDGDRVTVTSEKGSSRTFDLVIGADGIQSFMRSRIFPNVKPQAASKVAAYRAVVKYEDVYRNIPEARSKIGNTMDAWIGPGGYILLYPLSAGKELNIVTLFDQDREITAVEEADVQDLKDHHKGWDPFILKILDLVPSTKRWPLLVIPPQKTWSNEQKNVVLMGDAIHGMQNHMAQGAATAMEDGIFLGRVISEVLRGTINMREAIHLYELKRIPRAWHKAQSAFVMGELCKLTGNEKTLRDASMAPEVKAFDVSPTHPTPLPATYRPWQLFTNPTAVPSILYYDAEGDADFAIGEYLQNKGDMNSTTLVSAGLSKMWFSSIHDNGIERAPGSLKSKL